MQGKLSEQKLYSKSILTKIAELVSLLKSQINSTGKTDQLEKTIIQLEKCINDINDILINISNKKLKLHDLLEKGRFRQLLDIVGSWILKNFSSPKLISILSLMSSFFNAYEQYVTISQSDLNSIIQCEVYDKINEKKEYDTEISNNEKSSQEETLSKDSILTNHFLAAIYSLIVTVSNKPEIILKSKNLLRILTQISAQIADIDNVAIFFKKRRFISLYNTIIKELKKSSNDPNITSNLIQITKLLMYVLSKIAIRKPIYIDYMFRKAIPDKMSDIFLQYYQSDEELVMSFAMYTVFSTRVVDHKTFYWTKGIISIFMDIINKTKNEQLIECVSMAVYNLTKGSHEIQEDLRDLNYLELAKKLVVNYSKNNKILYFTIATLRFIKDDEFYNTMSQELLYTFFALFDYYYITIKNEINSFHINNTNNKDTITQLSHLSSKTHFVVLKEIIAILGNIIKNEIHSKPFIDKNLHLVLIDVKLTFIIFPKLIKNTTGALINLTNNNEICDNLCKIAAFIQSIYMVLHQYQDNQYIVDYEMKLIINLMKNEIAVNTFLSGELMIYILSFIKKFKMHENIILNSFKTMRCLIVKKKGMDEFNGKLFDFYQTIYDYKENENINKAYIDFIEDIIFFLNESNEVINVDIKIEIISLLAYLCNQSAVFKDIVDKSDNLLKSLNQLIHQNEEDEEFNKIISSTIALLPIEELNVINHK